MSAKGSALGCFTVNGVRVFSLVLMLLVAGVAEHAFAGDGTQESGPAQKVNPFIGTGKGPGDSENLFPGAVMPFGMVQFSPDTEDKGLGYPYYQDTIKGFSLTHMSGVGCANEGEVFWTATTGPVSPQEADF